MVSAKSGLRAHSTVGELCAARAATAVPPDPAPTTPVRGMRKTLLAGVTHRLAVRERAQRANQWEARASLRGAAEGGPLSDWLGPVAVLVPVKAFADAKLRLAP